MMHLSKASPASLTLRPASAPTKRLRYKNLRYGCKLCPDRVFSQLAAPLKSRTRESAVEGHVRRHHPNEAKRWRRIAYRWGVRAYYTDLTTADIRNPSELPPVIEDDDMDEKDHTDGVHVTDSQVAAPGYVYADEQPIDPELQTEPEADRPDSACSPYVKTEDGDPSVYPYAQQDLNASDPISASIVQYSMANTSTPGYMPQTQMSAAINTGFARPPMTGSSDSQSIPYLPQTMSRRRLQPPIEFPPSPHTNTTADNPTSPQPSQGIQSSYFRAQPQPQGQGQFSYQLQSHLQLSGFDNAAIAGTYGPRIAALAGRLVTYQFATKQEQASAFGQYLQETRRVLVNENHQLRMRLSAYEERYGVM